MYRLARLDAMRIFDSRKAARWMPMLLVGLLLVGIYYSSHRLMLSFWRRDDYNFCFLIPFIVAYLIWEKRREFLGRPSMPSWLGFILLVPGLLLFWLGELGGEYYTLYLSSWLVMVGLIWIQTGWQRLKAILFPLGFIVTLFPPPNFVFYNLSLRLKLISSWLSVAVIQAMGMAAYREGNVIDLGFTKLQVVDACSGLRYLLPLVVLSLLIAYLVKASWWKRILLVLSALPVSILVNGLRIVSVALLYPVWGPSVAKGFFHGFSGWVVFVASFGILSAEFWVLQRIGKSSSDPVDRQQVQTRLPRDNASHNSSGFFHPRFAVAVSMLAGTLVLSHGVEFREKVPISKSFNRFPVRVDEWIGRRESMEQKIIDALELSDYLIINYRNWAGETVNFYVAYYESQRKGQSIHSPESCLPAGGWVLGRSGMATVALSNHDPAVLTVNRAFLQKSAYRQLCYFWFPVRGRVLTNLHQLKLYNFWDALTRQRTDGALVRLTTPVGDMESVVAADRRLQKFVQVIVPVLDGFLPR